MKPIIYYAYDALCGWCYGFSPVIKKVFEQYRSQINFEVLSGGMITGERVGEIKKMAPYILNAYKRVEELSGVTFGEGFLDVIKEGSTVFSSEKPGIAMTIFKEYQPENSILFAHDLQYALNYYGYDLNKIDSYLPLIEKYGFNKNEFLIKMNSEKYKTKTYAEFKLVSEMGISGFPTTFIKKDEKYFVLARGFQNFEIIDENIIKILK